ncbi:haloacid dehalogenase superfamily protein, subfamily IA, variant 3 with third motif having DD or ED [Thioflavicoccus mobilis 8321]|uniref:Haloacid dehalogenase superfamily protein, subfamily IA, variant 3 with third motif having DD or ED n=1 Tax=Thioflavicoccus mobilis 8321 TaxID=765912 RepID=L0GR75_9GAMM|nr:HAD-IA family hydrolase [Thioflavicoccus mobilis]AGA89253.1 haloacid dehalogenase superfamily protein, subfamily IA, variant 3 with third motif having DD or ED [Thioflavicoccus mobilis 8321]
MLEAVIFDVDGTLADTEEAHRQAFNATFQEFGLPWDWDQTLYRQLLAVSGGKERIRHYCTNAHPQWLRGPDADERIAALHKHKTERYAEIVASGGVAPRPGVRRLIEELQGAGIRLAIATTTSLANVASLLENSLSGLPEDTFEVIGAGEHAADKKPSPAIYDWVLAELALPPERCLAIEDSENGLRAALGADLPTLVTESCWSQGDDFSGSLAVLSDLGEPEAPFRLLAGALPDGVNGPGWVDVDLLTRWHRAAV